MELNKYTLLPHGQKYEGTMVSAPEIHTKRKWNCYSDCFDSKHEELQDVEPLEYAFQEKRNSTLLLSTT